MRGALVSACTLALIGAAGPGPLQAQSAPGADATLEGVVRDVSGARMRAVRVRVFEGGGDLADGREPVREGTTDGEGRFAFPLASAAYRIEVFAPAFVVHEQAIALDPDTGPVDIVLDLDLIVESVEVTPAEELIADTRMSLTSMSMSGEELLDLPMNEEEMATYLMLLAGVDITGDLEEDILANFTIDGFDERRLPSPDQIAQVIIDPNSLSADGGGPRIEIITRPGTGRWRRSLDFGFRDESLNALTPGETRKEPRQTRDFQVEIEGPIIPAFMEVELEMSARTDERAGNSLRAVTPEGSVFGGVVRPEREREFQIETEFELSSSHSLDAGFSYGTESGTNAGVGGFTLPERAYTTAGTDWGLRVSERMFGNDFTNNIRFRLDRSTGSDQPVSDGFAIDVADAFRGGGGTRQRSERRTSVEIDNRMMWERGDWTLEWNGEVGYGSEFSIDEDNYNGTFDFSSLHDYCYATGFAGANCEPTRAIVEAATTAGLPPVYSDARGNEVAITGAPTTFTQASGNASLEFNEFAYDTSFQADRAFGERASLRLGVRYEGTNHSIRHLRLSPTVNTQFRLTPDTVLGAGAQLRFSDFGDTQRLLRNDGSTFQSELYISNPSFPDPFQGGSIEITEETASLWVLDPDYAAPYNVTPQFSVTQQMPGNVRLTVSYRMNFGIHQRRTRNINAPYPGTPLPEEILELPPAERQEVIDLMRPHYPFVGNMTQIESTGRSSSRDLRIRVQPRGSFDVFGMALSGNLNYNYRTASDDNDFNNPYLRLWGPGRRDHQLQSQFRIRLPEDGGLENGALRALAQATYQGTNLNFNFRANTGRLYSLSSGTDLNGDQSSRDRPPGVARNTEVGPGAWNLDMTLTKEFFFGEDTDTGAGEGSGGGWFPGEKRLRIQARFDNLLNHSQPRAYSGVLTSPFFGQPTGYTGGRTISLTTSLDF